MLTNQPVSREDDSVNGPRYQDYLYIEKQKELWRVGIANYFNKCGYEKWLIDAAMGNSIQMANLLNYSGISSGRAQKTGFLSVARPFIPLIGTAAEMRQQDDDNRMRQWENLNRLNSLVRIDVANELNEKGIESGIAINTIKIQDTIQYANALNGLGVESETAIQLALEVKPLDFQFNPKGVFGDEKHGLNKFMSDLGRRFEIHHWESTQDIAKPLTKASEKKIKQEFENAIQEIETQRAKYLNEVDITAANQRNLLQWQYGKGLSDEQTYQMNYDETYTALNEMRIQLIIVNLDAANNLSNVLGNMQYEKSNHAIEFNNWKQGFELAEAEIQLNILKKKLEIEHFSRKRVHELRQECQKTLEKVKRKGAKKLVEIVAASFIAPQLAQYLAAGIASSLEITSVIAKTALTGALTGMTFSGVTGILSGDTQDLAKNMFRGAVLGGVGGYVGEYAKSLEALKQSNNLRTLLVASVKATAGSLINHEKLGQGLVTQICQGLLSEEGSGAPVEFLDTLRDTMLRAAASAFVDTLINGGPLGDKLAIAGVSAFFQSVGETAGSGFSQELKELAAEKELDKPEMTTDKVLEKINNEDDPEQLLVQYKALVKKANKLSAEGQQTEADDYLNLVDAASKKHTEIKTIELRLAAERERARQQAQEAPRRIVEERTLEASALPRGADASQTSSTNSASRPIASHTEEDTAARSRPSNTKGASQRAEKDAIQTPSARSSHTAQTEISQDRVSQARLEAEQLNQRNKQSLIKGNNHKGDSQQITIAEEQISGGLSTSSVVKQPAFTKDTHGKNTRNVFESARGTVSETAAEGFISALSILSGSEKTYARKLNFEQEVLLYNVNSDHKKFFAGRYLPEKQNKPVDFLEINRQLAKERAASQQAKHETQRVMISPNILAITITSDAVVASNNQKEKLKELNQFFGINRPRPILQKAEDILYGRHTSLLLQLSESLKNIILMSAPNEKREWHPVLFSYGNSGIKTRLTWDSKGRQHYHDYNTSRYKASPFKTRGYSQSSREGIPLSFSLMSSPSLQDTAFHDVYRSDRMGNESVNSTVGLTPYAFVQGKAKVKHTVNSISGNIVGNAGFGVNIGTISVKIDHINGQGDLNVLTGQVDGSVNFERSNNGKNNVSMNVGVDAKLIQSNISAQVKMPHFNTECKVDAYLGVGVSAKFTAGYSSNKIKMGGSLYVRPCVKEIGIDGDYNVDCKAIKPKG